MCLLCMCACVAGDEGRWERLRGRFSSRLCGPCGNCGCRAVLAGVKRSRRVGGPPARTRTHKHTMCVRHTNDHTPPPPPSCCAQLRGVVEGRGADGGEAAEPARAVVRGGHGPPRAGPHPRRPHRAQVLPQVPRRCLVRGGAGDPAGEGGYVLWVWVWVGVGVWVCSGLEGYSQQPGAARSGGWPVCSGLLSSMGRGGPWWVRARISS